MFVNWHPVMRCGVQAICILRMLAQGKDPLPLSLSRAPNTCARKMRIYRPVLKVGSHASHDSLRYLRGFTNGSS